MDDLKSVTVGYLRELARKHLGTGYSKMKKEELVAALAAYVPALAKLARLAGITVERKRATAKQAASAPEPRKDAKAERPRTTSASKAAAPASRAASRAAATSRPAAPSRTAASSKAASRPAAAPKKSAAASKAAATTRTAGTTRGAATREAREPGTPARVPGEEAATSRTAGTPRGAAAKGAKEPGTPARGPGEEAATAEQVGQGRVSAPKRVAAKRASEKPAEASSTRPAKVVTFPPKPRNHREQPAEASPVPEASMVAAGAESGAGTPAPEAPAPSRPEAPPPPEQHAAEPVVEGFFVARVMGEGEARSHHLLGEPPRGSEPLDPPERDGGGGALPSDYEDDTVLLLPRDPHTLFVSWDFSAATRNRALQGVDSPRAVLKVFDGEGLAREVDVALESHAYYLHDLTPGRPYRVEAHFVGRDGRSRRIGPSSNRVLLPSVGPSRDTSIRFLRVPTRMPEPQVVPEAVAAPRPRAPEFEEREYISWRRVNLPGSAGVQDLPEARRERRGPGAPEEQPGAHLEGPPRPAGASDQRYLESMERAPGASDQRYLESVERPAGASDQRYLESVGRAPGASDQRYLESVGRPAGASDQRYLQVTGQPGGYSYLDVGRAPGASDQRYLESPGRAAGASDMRYLESSGHGAGASDRRYLESPPRAPGASDMRYLESPGRVAGASDMRYLESPPRAPGASDMRYLESPGRVTGASDMRYLESPPRAPGASDMRYLEYVARPPGASDQRYSEGGPAPQGSSEQTPSGKPPSGSGRS